MTIDTAEDSLAIADMTLAAPCGAVIVPGWQTMPGAVGVEALCLLTAEGTRQRLFVLGVDAESPRAFWLDCGLRLGRMIADTAALTLDLRSVAGLQPDAAAALCEGIALGGFRPQTIFSPALRLILSGDADRDAHRATIETALVIARWTNWARELVERPAGELRPDDLAQEIAGRAAELGIAVEIWGETRMEAEGFGATLGVGRGSDAAPCVVVLRHGAGPMPLGLAGKGVTFDTGGLNLKRDVEEIGYMKSDMAGAAAVAGALFAAVATKGAPDVIAVLPMVENMPSGRALRPGDRVRHPDKTTTEVIDTDCEGRLLLADALSWLARQKVRALIDVGTLSDGGGVGAELWGLWSNTPALAERLTQAGALSGDPGWHLPLRHERDTLLASRIADRRNTRVGEPDTGQVAACYLAQFAGGTPWAHIDNGSNAWLLRETGAWPEGATGAPLRALASFLCDEK
ncbi:leucyl aminopeptidase [Hoeflea sp. BAL378]|uniref:leucyl aminopeptidase family protein n=1 Tax=Hoeflea sp. BAL378 TaxID=1547437 RepID=UPI00126988C6|nr:leucyl aminopeptidase [Hoeflea sp. BAL378]